MKLIKTIKAGALLIPLLISFNSFGGDDCVDCANKLAKIESNNLTNFMSNTSRAIASRKIDNDGEVCAAVRRGNAVDLETSLRKRFNLSLEEGYLDIWCGDTDLMGTVLESPHERYALVKNIRRYFTRMGKPEMFSKLLLTKVSGRKVLSRIEYAIQSIERHGNLTGGKMHTRLLTMKKKYTAWLKKYPLV